MCVCVCVWVCCVRCLGCVGCVVCVCVGAAAKDVCPGSSASDGIVDTAYGGGTLVLSSLAAARNMPYTALHWCYIHATVSYQSCAALGTVKCGQIKC